MLKHHFDNLEQQHAAEKLGMWMFLVTEVLFFGGLFIAYTIYRMWYPAEFESDQFHAELEDSRDQYSVPDHQQLDDDSGDPGRPAWATAPRLSATC